MTEQRLPLPRYVDRTPADSRNPRAGAVGEGVAHVCDTGHFDRTLCPEPCGMMHSFCATCGDRQDHCAHDKAARAGAADPLRQAVEALDELVDRCERAEDYLYHLAAESPTTHNGYRLEGKRDGMRLARAYVEETRAVLRRVLDDNAQGGES